MKKILKNITDNYSIFNLFIPILFLTSLFYCLFLSFNEKNNYTFSQKNMSEIPVIYPINLSSEPSADIELAMALFSINMDENTDFPKYDSELLYRGLTVGDAFHSNKQVLIGKMAFDSWGILGSTLAHEIEIHCKQSFLEIEFVNFIYTMKRLPEKWIANFFPKWSDSRYDNLGYGSYHAEKEAYTYEINSMNRFNLSKKEIFAIKYTLENDLI